MVKNKILTNTAKQIKRSGWVGWASISVMTLAFLVSLVFAGLAYVSNLYIKFIERRSNLIVFFEVGMDKAVIDDLRSRWDGVTEIKSIDFTSEEEAYDLYVDYAERVLPEQYAALKEQEDKKLNSSLDIQLNSLSDFETVKEILQKDISSKLDELVIVNLDEEENVDSSPTNSESPDVLGVSREIRYKYSVDPTEPPIVLAVDNDSIEGQREAFFWMRVGGIAIITMLFIVVFFFTFMTVEFRLYNQMEEIGVMQLVGGSLFFIRSPYILEGGFYGFMGALLSTSLIGGIYGLIFYAYDNSKLTFFLTENFSKLPWPELNIINIGVALLGILATGFLVGAISSYMSIRRYIR